MGPAADATGLRPTDPTRSRFASLRLGHGLSNGGAIHFEDARRCDDTALRRLCSARVWSRRFPTPPSSTSPSKMTCADGRRWRPYPVAFASRLARHPASAPGTGRSAARRARRSPGNRSRSWSFYPRSSATTVRPPSDYSLARMPPVQPGPTMTPSTSFLRVMAIGSNLFDSTRRRKTRASAERCSTPFLHMDAAHPHAIEK